MNQQIDEINNDKGVQTYLEQTAQNYDLSIETVESAWFMKKDDLDFYTILEKELDKRNEDSC